MDLLPELIALFNSFNPDTIFSVGMEWFTRTKSGEFRFLDIPIFNAAGFSHLIIRFTFNLIITLIVVRYIYYPIAKRKDYLFTYVLMSITIFFLCTLLENVKLELGFALGLFAIFGIIRYRTDAIPIKEMTYLFVVIGIAVINALANKKVTHVELLLSNFGIVAATFALERLFLLKHETQKSIIYERIDLIVPERYEELVADLQARTGLNINRVEIGRIDFLRDIASLKIYYYESDQTHSFEDKSNFNS
jgi:hypothetical protein